MTPAANVTSFVAGGLGAAVISLFLWPLDPFGPARQNVAAAYTLFAEATLAFASARPPDLHHNEHDWKRRLRGLLEDARTALIQTAAHTPARTLRAWIRHGELVCLTNRVQPPPGQSEGWKSRGCVTNNPSPRTSFGEPLTLP